MRKNKLLIIDPQNDFCSPDGALYVKNAEKDMKRLKNFAIENINNIDDIYITQDTHFPYDIAHPTFWMDKNGNNPEPFTIITFKDFKIRKYVPSDTNEEEWIKFYLINIEKNKKQPLCIWPEHCIDTYGWDICDSVKEILKYAKNKNIKIEKYCKGESYKTENFSAIDAEIPYYDNHSKENIARNDKLISNLQNKNTNKLLIAGEASSHCLGATVKDIIIDPEIDIDPNNIYILKDTTSCVEGFEIQRMKYFNYFIKNNINIITTKKMEKILNE